MPRVTKRVLALPDRQGVRVVTLTLLGDATRAAEALALRRSQRTLHRFRVALRRLRSWLRAFRRESRGAIRRADRRTLRDIAAATNLGRDLDVQLAWLRRIARDSRGKRRRGARWLARQLAGRTRPGGDALDGRLLVEFGAARDQLHESLAPDGEVTRPRPAPGRSLAAAVAVQLLEHADALGHALRRVRSPADVDAAHRARITAKRLRYLVEQTAARDPQAADILARLRKLQRELGDLHDAHLLLRQVRAAEPPAAARAELRAVERQLDADAQRAFRRVLDVTHHRRLKGLRRDVRAFAKRLAVIRPRPARRATPATPPARQTSRENLRSLPGMSAP